MGRATCSSCVCVREWREACVRVCERARVHVFLYEGEWREREQEGKEGEERERASEMGWGDGRTVEAQPSPVTHWNIVKKAWSRSLEASVVWGRHHHATICPLDCPNSSSSQTPAERQRACAAAVDGHINMAAGGPTLPSPLPSITLPSPTLPCSLLLANLLSSPLLKPRTCEKCPKCSGARPEKMPTPKMA